MIRPMAGREAGRPGRVRQAAFALVTLLLFLALVEGGARLVERYGGPVPAEVGSPCDFQQVPREPVMERLDPYDRELLTIDPSWVDNDGQVVAVPDADQGADVTLKLVRGGLVIVAPGHLADNGYLGQPVRVVNEATHVVAEGVLVREDLVHLR